MQEGETVEPEGRAEPDELHRRGLDRVVERVDEPLARGRVRSVCRNDQIVTTAARERVDVDGGVVVDVRAEFGCPRTQCVEQHPTVNSGHPVAARRMRLTVRTHVDAVPVGSVTGEGIAQHRIHRVDVVEGGVGEDHPEPEDVVGAVALEDVDMCAGQARGEGDRGEQTAWPTPDAGD